MPIGVLSQRREAQAMGDKSPKNTQKKTGQKATAKAAKKK
jgi:hypothetical protein